MDPLVRFIERNDPLYRGLTPRGIAYGLPLTGGMWMPAPDGLHVIYLGHSDIGDLLPEVDYDNAVGVTLPTDADPDMIRNFEWSPWPASQQCAVGLRAVGKGGVEENNISQVVRFNTDAFGVPLPRVPNPPINLSVAQKADGKCVVRWKYSTLNQQIRPHGWHVYVRKLPAVFDYNTPDIETSIQSAIYDAVAGGAISGDTLGFVVRSFSVYGDEEQNEFEVQLTLDLTPPDVLPAPEVDYGEDINGRSES